MLSRFKFVRSAACLALLSCASLSYAAPSLDPAAARTVTVTRTGNDGRDQEIRYTVIMDHKDPLRWYYFPSDPRIMMNGQKPVFSLLRYQLPGDADGAAEGGILQFATTLDLQEQEAKAMKARIATLLNSSRDPVVALKRGNVPFETDAIQLSGMPFSDCKVALFAPSEANGPGKFVASASVEKGAGPKFGTQSMPFTLLLTKNGSDVYNALTTEGNAGLQVMYEVSYIGVTPAAGFTIEVDWEKTYEHFSHSENHRTSFAANIMGVDVEGAVGVKNTAIVNSLIEDGSFKLEGITSANFSKAEMDKYLDPLLQQIYKRIFDAPPIEKVEIKDAAKADDTKKEDATIEGARKEKKKADPKKGETPKETKPKAEDKPKEDGDGDGKDPTVEGADAKDGGDAKDDPLPNIIPVIRSETNIAMKSVKDINKTKLRFDMKFQAFEEQSTVVGGFIGVGGFPKAVRDGMVRTVGEGNWSKAIFALPSVSDLEPLKIASVDLFVDVVDAKGKSVLTSGRQGVRTAGTSWKRIGGKMDEVQKLEFLLAAKYEELGKEEFDKLQYRVTVKILQKGGGGELEYDYLVPLEAGESSLASPTANIRVVTLDPEGVMGDNKQVSVKVSAKWSTKDQRGAVKAVDRSLTVTLKAGAASPIVFLLPPKSTGLAPRYDVEVRMFPQTGASVLKPKLVGLTEENLFLEDALWETKP